MKILIAAIGLCVVAVFAKPSFASDQVELINLYDAFGKHHQGVKHDFGLSILVRYAGKTILFDSGTNSDVLEQNTKALGIDLREVDIAVASHAHLDHTGGFHYLLRVNPQVKIYYPHDTFGASAPLSFEISGVDKDIAKQLPKENQYFNGASTTAKLVTNGAHYNSVVYVKDHTEIAEGVNLVVTRSEYMGYFTKYPGVNLSGEATNDDSKVSFLGLPELSLSLRLSDGELLVVGCSHSTVETIVSASKDHLERDISLLVGGYHLLPYDQVTLEGIASRLKNILGVKSVAPAHCTGHLGFHVLSEEYKSEYQFFGLGSKIKL